MKKILYSIIFLCFLSPSFKLKSMIFEAPTEDGIIFNTLYGRYEITEPLLIELINHQSIRRLKAMPQGGPSHFVVPFIIYRAETRNSYTRFDHSINCMILVRKKLRGRNDFTEQEKLELQAAALLHDVSHGMLSHVIDLVMLQDEENPVIEKAYQDKILDRFLVEHGIVDILNKYNINLDMVIPTASNINYNFIKRRSGTLCIDSIEYTLSECFLTGILKKGLIKSIVNNLNYNKENNLWYFTDADLAERFGSASINLVNLNSGSLWNVILYNLFALIIKNLIEENVLTESDISYEKTDIQFWVDLNREYRDRFPYINHIMNFTDMMRRREKTFRKSNDSEIQEETFLNTIKAKFRATDPCIKIGDEYLNLSEISNSFKSKFEKKRERIISGREISFIDESHPLANIEVISGC